MTWQTIDTAPRGSYRETVITQPNGKTQTRKTFVPDVVHTWKSGGEVILTWYLPEVGRWNGYSKNHPPTHWAPYDKPLPPEET